MPIFLLARCVLLFLLLCPHIYLTADDDIYFYHLGTRDGLSQVNIMSIYQDEFGAMWFGSTEGLNRYNGHEIEVFRPYQNGTGLSQNTIYDICGNKSGAIYLRNDRDLVRYDLHTQQFENIQRGEVYAIAYEHGVLWAVIGSRIMQYDEQAKQLKEYAALDQKVTGVFALRPTKDGTIWIGASHGLVSVSGKDPKDQQFVIEKVYVNCLYQDKKDNLWIGTFHHGAYMMTPSGNLVNYRHHPKRNSLSNNQVRSFIEDDSGNIWIATFYGLNRFDPQTDQWKQYVSNDNLSYSLSHSSVFSLYKDKQGTIWTGTYFGGVNYFNPDTDIFRFYESNSIMKNHLSFPYVSAMTEDKHGNLWVCTEGGALNCLNLKTREFSHYIFDEPGSVTGYNQKALWYSEDKDRLYVGMHNRGLAIFDIKTKQARVLTRNESPRSLPNNTINKMQFYKGYLYLLTQSGLVKMDIDTEEFYRMTEDPVIGKVLSKGIGVGTFFIDSHDRLWTTLTNGLWATNMKTGEVRGYEHDESNERSVGRFGIVNIFESSKREVFFASTGSGVFRYDPKSDDFDNYTKEKNGLPSNYCYYISEAPSGKLILLYNEGFVLFDPENPRKNLFRSSTGFPIVGFNTGNTSYITCNKEIFVGGINGLVSFREEDLGKINKSYTLFFDKLFINNQQVYPGDQFDILKETLPLCPVIDLKYDQNNITIEFATSNYLQTKTLSYEYKLEGFDQGWIPANTRIISYTNLNTGNYTLLVRETSEQGEGENNSNVYSLVININPPFYLTKTAFVIYGILLLLAVAGVFRFYLWRTKLETTLEFERKDKERIEELNRTKLKFFTNVSHEFRTPLTLIIGQVEALFLQGDLSPKVYNKLTRIHKNTRHLQNLISELLDFRKQEQGFYKLNIKHVELVAYIKDIYDSFEDHAVRRQIKYKLDCVEKEIHIYIDPVHLQKAIYNLLSNAFKYTSPSGEITLKVKLRQSEVLIQIIDNGIGIPPESLNKVFERFYQLEYRSSGLTLGTGIGLALTWEIVTSHKGTISVESTLNEGSIFTITLKLGTSHFSEEELIDRNAGGDVKAVDSPAFEDEDTVPAEKEITIEGEKPVVLVVDDNGSLLEMLTESFAPYYKVYTAQNGKEGLDAVYKIQPDLVISDIMMPEISGKELCYRMKNNVVTSHIPIVLLTAQASDNQIIDGYMFGADAYITKPFSMKVLISRCNNLIRNRQILYAKFTNQEDNVIPFHTVSEQDQALIDKAVKIIRDNFSNPGFDMNKLGVELGMGRSKLYVKIKEVTGFTPNELTLNLKLQEAANLLDGKLHMNISEIAFELGFSSTKYFAKCFKTFYGMVPREWRNRNKNLSIRI